MNGSSNTDRLSLRWALILLLAGLAAVVVGALTLLQSGAWPTALLAGLAAGATTMAAAHQIVARA